MNRIRRLVLPTLLAAAAYSIVVTLVILKVLDATIGIRVSGDEESEGLDARKDWYGGAGYGTHGRPDMSNTQTMLEALYDAGLSALATKIQ